MEVQAEYIWLDGDKVKDEKTGELKPRTQELRGKTKIVELGLVKSLLLKVAVKLLSANKIHTPFWGFDGSSTLQAEGNFSDCKLRPVRVVFDPIRGKPNLLVLCDVLNPDSTPHKSNMRVLLAAAQEKYQDQEPRVGIEQEYTLYLGNEPLGFVMQGGEEKAKPQGPYYCGVGAEVIFGRPLIEAHTKACLESGLSIAGTNAEVMCGQWEFQIGPINSKDPVDPLRCADELWLARWLLKRLGEDYGWAVSFAPKPVEEGDWNGAGAHTNFSTKAMREKGGLQAVREAAEKLSKVHKEHISVYGLGNEKRLTGKHETCDINTFRVGDSDRGASIRIPMATLEAGRGYLEDRRPAANMDPYLVLTALLETVCGE